MRLCQNLLIGLSQNESTSTCCTLFDVQLCQAVRRNLVFRLMQCLEEPDNNIVLFLLPL